MLTALQMHGFTPVLEIDVDGKPVGGVFYSLIVSCRLRDNEGQTVDSLQIKLDDAGNQIELPRKGAEISVRLGFKETGIFDKGRFKVETFPLSGDVESGEFVTIEANAADLRKDAKAEGNKDYHNKTFGEIVRAEASKMGLKPQVTPELENIRFDWKPRIKQSRIDFITRLADEVGGIAKPAGGKLIVQKRGSGQSASGQQLETIIIKKGDCTSWEINPDGRMQYGTIESHWVDPQTGKLKKEKITTGLEGPSYVLKDKYPDQARAKRAAEAEKGRTNRNTGNGTFTLYGRPEAQAGAPVEAVGFRTGINGEWRASAVDHIFQAGPSGGYTTVIEVKAKEDGKKGKNDDE